MIELSDELINIFKSAKNIVVFTGAGISAESGIPTFRDALTGHWSNHDVNQIANSNAFLRNPAFVYSWYEMRRNQINSSEPNPGHFALAELEEISNVTIVTQNVDNLHERAGSKNIIHLHGSIHEPRCFSRTCSEPFVYDDIEEYNIKEYNIDELIEPPRCLKCGDYIRPGIVWFNEFLDEKKLQLAHNKAYQSDLFLIVGTSGIVYPAADIPFSAIKARVIEINPNNTEFSKIVNYNLNYKSGEVLPEIVKRMKQ